MAIILNNKPDLIDDDNKKFVGLELPLKLSSGREGYFQSTSLSTNAIKQNLRLLLNTKKGERLFQPEMGLDLDKLLFENDTGELVMDASEKISKTISDFLPFVGIRDIDVKMSEPGNFDERNKLMIKVMFYLKSSPNILDSIDLEIE